jgi:XTP/dITP diphosphohydrolase
MPWWSAGVYSARYAGEDASDEQNLDKLLRALEGLPAPRRSARYRCVIVYVGSATTRSRLIGEGSWEGRIIDDRRGTEGFGYDPSFVPHGDSRTVAEMPAAEKARASHRGQALRAFSRSSPPGVRVKTPPLALYAHFPWCVQKCPYCDFNSYTLRRTLPEERYIDTLLRDLDAQAEQVAGRRW